MFISLKYISFVQPRRQSKFVLNDTDFQSPIEVYTEYIDCILKEYIFVTVDYYAKIKNKDLAKNLALSLIYVSNRKFLSAAYYHDNKYKKDYNDFVSHCKTVEDNYLKMLFNNVFSIESLIKERDLLIDKLIIMQ